MRRSAAFCVLAAFTAIAGCSEVPLSADPGHESKVTYYKEKIARFPDHYPSYTGLAAAYLEKAKLTGDPEDLLSARASAHKSNEIQLNFEALKILAKIEGFAHRFNESISWAEKALEAAPVPGNDPEIDSILIDAYLGLGNAGEVEKIFASIRGEGFYSAAAKGQFLRALKRNESAAGQFQAASGAARTENADEAQAWAEVMTAGVWLDAGFADKALPFLERAEELMPGYKPLLIHRAEYFVLKGRAEESLAIYKSMLKGTADPEIHRRMFLILANLGKTTEAREHLAAAEKGFRKAIDAGEIYTLGPLAQILCDANERLGEAEKLSEENLKYKRDKEAVETHLCIVRKKR